MELIKNNKLFIYSILGALGIFLIIVFSGKKEINTKKAENTNKINNSNKDVAKKNKELKEKINGKSITRNRKKSDNIRPIESNKEGEGETGKKPDEPTITSNQSDKPIEPAIQ